MSHSPLMSDLREQALRWIESCSPGDSPDPFLEEFGLECAREAARLGASELTVDLLLLVFLRKFARFGYFLFGPISIDVRLIEDVVERGIARPADGGVAGEGDMARFARLLLDDVRRLGRRRADELALLLAFMRWGDGLPARVFGELGVTPEQVIVFARGQAARTAEPERLYSPEEAADYFGVHVQTVRAWIRSGRLRASRLAGQRALRIRASDLASVLEPVEPGEV